MEGARCQSGTPIRIVPGRLVRVMDLKILDQFKVDRTKKAVGDAMLTNLTRNIAALSCVLLLGLAGCSDSGAEGSTNAAGDGTGSSSATPAGDQSNAIEAQPEIQSTPPRLRATLTDSVGNQKRTVQPNLVAAVQDRNRAAPTTQPTELSQQNKVAQLTVSGDSSELIVVAEPISLNLGSVATGQQAKGTVRLVNTGDRPMRIIDCKASCGCTTTKCPRNKELQPGESVEVEVQMKAGRVARRLSKSVSFIVEGQPLLKVPVSVDVVAYVAIEPSRIDLRQTTDGRVVIRSLDDQPFRVLSMNPPWIEAFDGESQTEHVLYLPLDDLQAQARVRTIDFSIDHPQTNKVSMTLSRARSTPSGDAARIAAVRPPAVTADNLLAAAARSGDVEAIGQAIKDGKNLEQSYEDGATLLGIAASARQAEVVRVLLEAGAKMEARDQKGRMPLMAAVQTRDSSVEVVRALIDKGADVNTRGTMIGGTPLSWAAGPFSNPEIVAALVAGNADVNQADNTGMTPLMWAARYGAPATVKVLLDAGADMSATNKQGQTSLDLVRQKRSDTSSVQIIEMLETQPPSGEKTAGDSDS